MHLASPLHRARRGVIAIGAALLLAGSLPLAAGAAESGFKTEQPAMMVPGPGAPLGTEIKPIITVGDTIGGYRFEAIPDGISYSQSGKNQATVLVNHETSKVPFPYNLPASASNLNDYDNSQLSELVIRRGGQILSAEMVITSAEGYHRFCSNFLATTDGFEERPLLFTNEEGIDWVLDDGAKADGWTNTVNLEGAANARQIGAVIAYDPATGQNRAIWGMGRHNHENSVAIPNYGGPVLLSGDDSFNQNAPQSQVYAYIADDADDVWDDEGTLYAFAPDSGFADVNDYYDFRPNGTIAGHAGATSISGRFVAVPKNIATGKDAAGEDMLSSDIPGFVAPPSDNTWQRGPGITSGPGIDGPQWILEQWGDLPANNVFQFLRIEDIAYDKRPGMSNVVYLVDSGRGQNVTPGPGASTNGRVWKMVLDEEDPTIVESLSILIEGDDAVVKAVDEIHQPDNIESTLNGLLITEDPGSQQQFTAAQQLSDAARATTARLMHYRFSDGALTAVLKVDQSADEGPTDDDAPTSPGSWGAWESSGIVDVSAVFGPNKFLIDVQAHTLFVDDDPGPDNIAPEGPDWTWKREGGQLLLVTLPGA